MKTLARLFAVAMVVAGMEAAQAAQESDKRSPKYSMELIYNHESKDFIFGIGNSRFATVSALKRFIASLPAGSTLEWAPGCLRVGNEPLLSSEVAMRHFVRFCKRKGIKFIRIPAG